MGSADGSDPPDADIQAIRRLVARQFDSVSWTADAASDWDRFSADFVERAQLFPTSRPVRPTSVAAFVERMRGLAREKLDSLEETLLGIDIRVFGNVAVAFAACGMREDGGDEECGIEAILLVREGGEWRVAAQAWDMERPGLELPPEMLEP